MHIVYKVRESDGSGNLISLFRSEHGYLILADAMIKVRHACPRHRPRFIMANQPPVVVDDAHMISIDFKVYDQETRRLYRQVSITTQVEVEECPSERGGEDNFYSTEKYHNTVIQTAYKLRKWTNRDVTVAKILAIFAARDSAHIFWDYGKFKVRKRELDM